MTRGARRRCVTVLHCSTQDTVVPDAHGQQQCAQHRQSRHRPTCFAVPVRYPDRVLKFKRPEPSSNRAEGSDCLALPSCGQKTETGCGSKEQDTALVCSPKRHARRDARVENVMSARPWTHVASYGRALASGEKGTLTRSGLWALVGELALRAYRIVVFASTHVTGCALQNRSFLSRLTDCLRGHVYERLG